MIAAQTQGRYRIWIARTEGWRAADWTDLPPAAVALEPAEEALYSADEAAAYLEGFNGELLAHPDGRWAIAVPVHATWAGDAIAGEPIAPGASGCLSASALQTCKP